MIMTMNGTHSETLLNSLIKPELMQLLLNTEANPSLKISNLFTKMNGMLGNFENFEGDKFTVKNVIDKLVETLVLTKR